MLTLAAGKTAPPATSELVLQSVMRVTHDVAIVTIVTIDGAANPIQYREGQFIALELPGGHVRSYSLAQPCSADGCLELHVRLRAGGVMARWLDSGAVPGAKVRVHGPYGDCVWPAAELDQLDQLDRSSDAADATIMLATGTGIAPLYAMLKSVLSGPGSSPIALYWGGRTAADLYLMAPLQRLAETTPRFSFTPVLSQADTHWQGERGHVQHLVVQRHPDLRNSRVYACGSPAMARDARALLTERCGLPPARFLADAFEPAQQTAVPASAAVVQIHARLHDGDRRTLNLASGSSLYQGLKAASLIQGVCGGNLSCGTCRIHPDPAWQDSIPAPSRSEKRLLATLDEVSDGDRLACQIDVTAALAGLAVSLYPPAW